MLLLGMLDNFLNIFLNIDNDQQHILYNSVDMCIQCINLDIYSIYDRLHSCNMGQGNLFGIPMSQGMHKGEVGIPEHKFYLFHKHMYHAKVQGRLEHTLECKNQRKYLEDIMECKFDQYFNQNRAEKQGIEVHITMCYYLQNKEEDIARHINYRLNMHTNY